MTGNILDQITASYLKNVENCTKQIQDSCDLLFLFYFWK